jgi:hypothetical protein
MMIDSSSVSSYSPGTPITTATTASPSVSCCSLVADDVGDIVANMLMQEQTTYKREDYLTLLLPSKLNGETIDASWRQRIVEWMYGVGKL